MAISLNSRYADGHVTASAPNPRLFQRERESRGGYLGMVSNVAPVVIRAPRTKPPVEAVYVWRQGDRWDRLAGRFGLPRTDWWVLLDANPQIEFPCAVTPGTYINIPASVRRRVV